MHGRAVAMGIDVGTSSTKGVLVTADGSIVATAVRSHEVDHPRPGHYEMDPTVWWHELCAIAGELTASGEHHVTALGVSGMGPCVVLTDAADAPVRPAILYGVDMRTTAEIADLEAELPPGAVRERCGSELSSQAAGVKVLWVARHEPDVYARAQRLHTTSSWLVARLTAEHVIDHHSASQFTPMYDAHAQQWYAPWVERVAPGLTLPRLDWSDREAGRLTAEAADATGLPSGIPVTVGTVDAWAEAVSVGAHEVGDLMLMYGTTMFLVATVDEFVTHPALWGTVGVFEGTRNLAGGLATSGSITAWLAGITGQSFEALVDEARQSPPRANGLLVLPYFAGERTPVQDPDARGVIAGLTLAHTRGDLYRAVLEGTALAVRHNVETLRAAGAAIRRVVAVGGGTQGELWTQIVSDVSGIEQVVPTHTIGAAYGDAYLATRLVGEADITDWNPPARIVRPDTASAPAYDEAFELYRELYESTRAVVHRLAAHQHQRSSTTDENTDPTATTIPEPHRGAPA